MEKLGWRLIFADGLMDTFLARERCADIRIMRDGSNIFRKGQIIEGHFFGEDEGSDVGLKLEVMEDTRTKQIWDLSPEERNLWGGPVRTETSLQQMMGTLRGYYPDITEDTIVSFNVLRLARRDGKIIYCAFPHELRDAQLNRP